MENGEFGIGQILKLESLNRPTEGISVLIDKIFTDKELKDLKKEDFSEYKILALSNLSLIMLKIKRWVIFDNYPLITTNIPLWAAKDMGAEDNCKNGILSDFGNNFIRHLPYEEVSHMRPWFVRGPVYFENLLKRRFIDPTFLPENADESYFLPEWPDGTITEEDMVIHADEYYTTGDNKKPMVEFLKNG